MTKTIPISDIRMDGGTQTRVEMDPERIETLKEFLDICPEVVVYFDQRDYWLADGFYRVSAAKANGKDEILADVRNGTLRDALLFAVGCNAAHDSGGLPRTRADKRAAVKIMLTDPEWSKWSNPAIAKQCHVSEALVRSMGELRINEDDPQRPRIAQKGGKTVIIKTKNIGKRKESADQKLGAMTPKDAKKAIEQAQQVCTCTCPACRKCRKKMVRA